MKPPSSLSAADLFVLGLEVADGEKPQSQPWHPQGLAAKSSKDQ